MRGSKCVMRNRQWTGEWPGSYGDAMASTSVVETARRSLGPVGAYLPIPFTGAPPIDQQREAARRLERAGYPAARGQGRLAGRGSRRRDASGVAAFLLFGALAVTLLALQLIR